MRRIHLIRHAVYEGYCPSPARYVGRTDPELSPEGRKQAALLGQGAPELQRLPVWASPARRTRETAALAFPETDVRLTRSAMEICYGRIEGLNVVEVRRLYPEFYLSQSRSGSPALDFGAVGGESMRDLIARAEEVIAEMQPFLEVVLVSHAIFLTALCCHLIGAGNASLYPFGFCSRITLERAAVRGFTPVDASESVKAKATAPTNLRLRKSAEVSN